MSKEAKKFISDYLKDNGLSYDTYVGTTQAPNQTLGGLLLDMFIMGEQTQPLKDEIKRLDKEYKNLADKMIYKGNSISYIHEKMLNYGSQAAELKQSNTWVSVDELPDDKYLGVKFLCKIETITGEEFQICEWFNDDIEGEPSRFLIDCGWPMTNKKLISYKTIST